MPTARPDHPLAEADLWGQMPRCGLGWTTEDIPHHSDPTALIFIKGHLRQLCDGYERVSWLHGVSALW